jgi:catechol 2,3-dioxygenase-like lactoylglutathione lyase family enzyme
VAKTHSDRHFAEWNDFSLAAATSEKPTTRRLHTGFAAPTREHVDAFWQAGTESGYRDDGAPGLRAEYGDDYYGAFLLDPDGNSSEAVHFEGLRRDGVVDHLWLRVADMRRAKRFYETVAPYAGFRLATETPERARFAGDAGSFSIVLGEPTHHLHMAFPASEDAAVRQFHAAATAAGYADNGEPGERDVYHRGYYSAFVLDPDGNNIEVVNHHR